MVTMMATSTPVRNRMGGSTPKAAILKSSNGNDSHYDAKHGSKKYPILSIILWAFLSIVILFFVGSALKDGNGGNGGYGSPSSPSSSGVMRKSKKSKKPFQHEQRTGDGKRSAACPEAHKKKFWMEDKKINQPVARALRMRGWQRTDDPEQAQVVWTYVSTQWWYDQLKPWQRYNHIPHYKLWNNKDTFVTYMLEYAQKSGKELPAVPETYRLDNDVEIAKYRARMAPEGGGMDIPWVLKKPNVNRGKGITMLGPHTKELENVMDVVKADEGVQNYIIQRYVCNEMTIAHKKFDFRIFWIVASLDPLIVMYHDGYVRIGNAAYKEDDFSSTTQHLTTHTGLAAEGKGTWDDLVEAIRSARKSDPRLKKIRDPVAHVRNQVKQVMGEMAAAFREATLNADSITAENGFGFYGADFIIDRDLDVFLIEPQHGCGLDEDFQFRVDMHNALFTEMIDATEEIWERQERGLPLQNKYLKNHGDYEIVYNDDWMYEYKGYTRSKDKKGCEIAKKV